MVNGYFSNVIGNSNLMAFCFFNGTLDMFQRAYFARDNKDAKRECVCVPSACHIFFLQKNV